MTLIIIVSPLALYAIWKSRSHLTNMSGVLCVLLAMLATTIGFKVNAPLNRRAALSALVLAPAATMAADNAGTYGGSSGGYQAMPGSTPVVPTDASTAAASSLSAGQRRKFEESKAQQESVGVKMTPAEIEALEKKILAAYPGMN